MTRQFSNGRTLHIETGDITRVAVDAIANAANSGLHGGGGVDGAIHRAGGPSIMRELDEIRARTGGCPTGSAVATSAGNLPAKWVFHAVGPVYQDGAHGEPQLLASAYQTCLRLADERGARSISFPAISAGIYGYPMAEAAQIALRTVREHLESAGTTIQEGRFVLFDRATYDVWERVAATALSP